MVSGPDYNVVNGFEKLWHEASISDVENGKTTGINKQEFDGMSLFLKNAIDNNNASEETKNWARQKLADLNTMVNSRTNKEFLQEDIKKSAPRGVLNNILDFFKTSEQDLYEENIISHDTMLIYNEGGIEELNKKDLKGTIFDPANKIIFFNMGNFGFGSGNGFNNMPMKDDKK